MVENKLLDVQKLQSHLIAMKAAANVMLAEAAKVERMLEAKPNKKQMELEAKNALSILSYQKRFQRRLRKTDN